MDRESLKQKLEEVIAVGPGKHTTFVETFPNFHQYLKCLNEQKQ